MSRTTPTLAGALLANLVAWMPLIVCVAVSAR